MATKITSVPTMVTLPAFALIDGHVINLHNVLYIKSHKKGIAVHLEGGVVKTLNADLEEVMDALHYVEL